MSFCIPAYNKAETVRKIINGILISDDPRFEVVVCDNASTDNTQEVLSQIHDERFKYFRNNEGITPFRNWFKALGLGCGEWLFLVISRDKINGEYIPQLIEFLDYAEKNNISYLYDGYSKYPQLLEYSGIDAMIHFIDYHHPTGSIFNGSLFRVISEQDKEYYITHSDVYPENFLRRDLLLQGNGAYIMSGVYTPPALLIDISQIKSTVDHDKDLYDLYYAPRRRTIGFFEFIDMLESCNFTASDLDKFFRAKFSGVLSTVSIGWKYACANYEWQAHYGQTVRHISIAEMIRNIFTAYNDTKSHLRENGTLTPSRQRIMRFCLVKTLVKVLVYWPVKGAAKKILEPLGIWKVLKTLKRKIKNSPA